MASAFVGQLRVLTHGVSVKPFTPAVVKRVTKDAARAGAGALASSGSVRTSRTGGSPSPRSGPASLDAAPSPPYPPAPEGQPSYAQPRGQPARPAECPTSTESTKQTPILGSSAGAAAGSLDARRAARQGSTKPPLLSPP